MTVDRTSQERRPTPAAGESGGMRPALWALLLLMLAMRVWYLADRLDASRSFDERYGFRNVTSLLRPGEGKLTAFYPSLSFAPQAAVLALSEGLHRLTGAKALSIYDPASDGGYSATAYLLVRSLSAVYGVLSLALLYALGARLYSPAVGLLAALLFGATPRHIQSSSHFKPDVLLALLVLLAFWWSLDAAQTGRRRRFWLAGIGLGLAVSAKYTGIAALFPLAVAALAGHWHDRQRRRWLLEAGVASLLTFAVLNPHLAVIVRFLPRLWRIGSSKGAGAGVTFASAASRQLEFFLDHHGPWILALALLGAAGIAWQTYRQRGRPAAVPGAMALALVGCYSLLWIAVRFFRGQNHLPVAAVSSLFAAWALWRLGCELTARLPPHLASRTAWSLGLALAVAILIEPAAWAYRQRVPTTLTVAIRDAVVLLEPPHRLRSVLVERDAGRMPGTGATGGLGLRRVVSVVSEPATADVELFPAARLAGSGGGAYRSRLVGLDARRIEPAWFHSRGTPLELLVRRWELTAPPAPPRMAAGGGRRRLLLLLDRPLVPEEWISLELRVYVRDRRAVPDELAVDGRRLSTMVLGMSRHGMRIGLPRFRPREPAGPVELLLPAALIGEGRPVQARLARWVLTPLPAPHP